MKNPTFTMVLETGELMTGELYPEIAPQSVGNFVSLANGGFYDGLTFHRCIPGFMIQGGCPLGVGTGGPGYSIKGEFGQNGHPNPLKHTLGVLSMARSMMKDSAGSQFFIMTSDSPHLDGSYAAFGKILDGMDAAQRIVNTRTGAQDKPVTPQKIRTIRVETYGLEYPFTKL
jgi:peptidyl-prolyl cis-trans isomerase B (cyclophilin B)